MERIKDIVFATNNAHKLEEVRQIVGERFRVLSLKEINCHDDIPETADTLEGNALIKARWIKERYGFDCFADDTGLMVDALGGAPGVHTARYAGDDCNSEKNVSKMLSELEGVEERNAHFSTVIALIYEGQEVVMEGRVDGIIATKRGGNGGFGYDPIVFLPDQNKTIAQISSEEKHAISHRGKAVRALQNIIEKI